MSLRAKPVLLLALVLALGSLPATGAPPPASVGPGACEPRHVPGLGDACLVGPGHYLVVLEDGFTLHTHGPDPAPASAGPGFGPDSEERAPLCAEAPRIQVLYGYLSTDRTAEVAEGIRTAVRRMDALLRADALESGGVEATYRVACDAAGAVSILAFPGPVTGGAYTVDYDAVVEAARAAGHKSPATNYLIFYDGASASACGAANIANDDRLSADNENLKGPNYGVVFAGCWEDRTPMHENAHNMGAVQQLAPMSDLLGHCLEGHDVMCYTSDVVVLCGDRVHFDCGHDTYFHAKPPEGSWLATHWNLGSRLNLFLAFSDAPPPPAPAPPPSEAKPAPPPPAKENRTSPSNETAPAPPAPQEPGDEEPVEPQAVVPDAPEPVLPEEPPAEVPALAPVAILVALAGLALGTRARPK